MHGSNTLVGTPVVERGRHRDPAGASAGARDRLGVVEHRYRAVGQTIPVLHRVHHCRIRGLDVGIEREPGRSVAEVGADGGQADELDRHPFGELATVLDWLPAILMSLTVPYFDGTSKTARSIMPGRPRTTWNQSGSTGSLPSPIVQPVMSR